MTSSTAPRAGGPVPPATSRSRQVTESIRTVQHLTDCVSATYRRVSEYNDPNDAFVFTRMVLARAPKGGKRAGRWPKRWKGENVIACFGLTETAALAALIEELDRFGMPYERDEARAALVALSCATASTPWELRPLGARPTNRPRRKRTKWVDQTTGHRINIYPETLKPHANPNCPCERCKDGVVFKKNEKK